MQNVRLGPTLRCALLVMLASTACTDDPFGTKDLNLLEALEALGNVSTFAMAARFAGLETALESEGPWTVFAPPNPAFDALPATTHDAILQDEAIAFQVIGFHVAVFVFRSDDLRTGERLTTVAQEELVIDATDGLRVNDVAVVETDIDAENGVIHIVGRVLIPPSVASQPHPSRRSNRISPTGSRGGRSVHRLN